MKKLYVTPTASFEALEEESLMIETSGTLTTNRAVDPPVKSQEISIFDTPITAGQGGLISAGASESDD